MRFKIPFDGDPSLFELQPSSRILSRFATQSFVSPHDEDCGSFTLDFEYTKQELQDKGDVAERKLTAAKHKEKRLQSELKRLTRSERTHRLCTRAGMLETFLKEPTVLTDEDVMELLTFIFQSEAVQKKLNLLIESRRKTQEADEGENP